MKTCAGCKYAEWVRTKSGRLHPSGAGRCAFPVKPQVLPAAFYYIHPPKPLGGQITRREEWADHCPCYAPEGA